MESTKPSLDTIRRRISVRTYAPDALADADRRRLESLAAAATRGPFGSALRFSLLDLAGLAEFEIKSLGTYGMIKGARFFLAGGVAAGPVAMVDYGYRFEELLLAATGLGLGSCWLGGTMNRKGFAARLGGGPDELVPAVSPVGPAAGRPRIAERVVRSVVGARTRLPAERLFFQAAAGTPAADGRSGLAVRALAPDSPAVEGFAQALEAVRIGPSASNKQPWRLVSLDENGDAWGFYLELDPKYNSAIPGIKIQELDIGIAICHWDIATAECGLAGAWSLGAPAVAGKPWTPVARWARA